MNVSEHPIDREEVMAYLDGELAATRAALVVAHLEQCAECRTLAADLRDVSRQMATWQLEPVPATIDRAVRDAVHRPASPDIAKRRPRWLAPAAWRMPRWALVSAAVAAVAVLVVMASLPGLYRSAPLLAPARPTISAAAAPPRIPARGLGTLTAPSVALQSPAQKPASASAAEIVGPRMARTATLHVMIDDVDRGRTRIDQLVRARQGYISELTVGGDAASGRSLVTTLRVPAGQLDAALAEFRTLGRVVEESQSAEDVLEQFVDLQARLSNARTTEQRLNQLVRDRTGTVAEVLEAEQEIARVRGEIERLDAQRKNLDTRVELATVQLRVSETPKASLELGASPASARLRNALVDGSRRALESALEATLLVLRHGPWLLLWVGVLAWPARRLWRRFNGV